MMKRRYRLFGSYRLRYRGGPAMIDDARERYLAIGTAFPPEVIALSPLAPSPFFDISWEKYIDRGLGAAAIPSVIRASLLGNVAASSKKFITFPPPPPLP